MRRYSKTDWYRLFSTFATSHAQKKPSHAHELAQNVHEMAFSKKRRQPRPSDFVARWARLRGEECSHSGRQLCACFYAATDATESKRSGDEVPGSCFHIMFSGLRSTTL